MRAPWSWMAAEEEEEEEEEKGVRLPVQLLTLRLVLCLIKKGMTLKERF